MTRYEVLHYAGDLTGVLAPGALLGHDEVGMPFAVLDAELDPDVGPRGRTTVQLATATPDQMRAAMAAQLAAAGVAPAGAR